MKIREDEKIVATTKKHWSRYLAPVLALPLLAGFVMIVQGNNPDPSTSGVARYLGGWVGGLLLVSPWLIRAWLIGKTSKYVLTDKRFYVSEGILRRRVLEMNLRKVNDIQVEQGLVQRILGSGDVRVLSGNSSGDLLRGLDRPHDLKEAISRASEAIQEDQKVNSHRDAA
jgi:uncharacterized membrane protein YdbT with pleckstrin-like domain